VTPETFAAVIGVISGMIGGLFTGGLQYVATVRQERRKHIVETRTNAYNAYIVAVSKVAIYNGATGNKPVTAMAGKERESFVQLHMEFQDAKNRLALYASPRVLEKLGIFSSRHAAMAVDADVEAYIDVIEAMREDSYAENYDGFRRDVDNMMLRGSMK
jgi:hypothetical protein